MSRRHLCWTTLVVSALLYLPYPVFVSAADQPALTMDQIKQFLLTAKIVGSKQAGKGTTHPWRLTLSDGTTTHDASFQPIDEHRTSVQIAGRTELNFVDSYKYNIAAYELAELVGFDDMTPVYVERKFQGHNGSLSWWLPVMMDDVERMQRKTEPPDPDAWNRQMYKIRVFDQLVYDADPNLTNVLISPDWKLWRVDFTRAFRPYHELQNPKDLVHCDRQMFEKLKLLNADNLAVKTKKYLTTGEVQAVMARRDKIVAHFQKLISEKGEQEVLY